MVTKGYNSYHGRMSGGKIVQIVVLALVLVGAVAHPMTEEHSIEWIEIMADGRTYRKFLHPGDAPVAEFRLKADKVTAREYCNLHGLWQAEG